MFRVYCDRCKKQFKNDPYNYYEQAQSMKPGDCIAVSLNMVVENKGSKPLKEQYPNDIKPVDICERCQKELNEVVKNFMRSK